MLQFEWSKTVRAIRLSSALIVTFLITWSCEVPQGIWALITCCFVLYEYTTFGGVLTKSFLRFFGTAVNAIVAIFLVYIFSNNPIINLIFLVIGIFINAYLFLDSSKTYTSVLGCVTLLIVFINFNSLDIAILRTFNVLLGEIISILTFYFVFPEYARDNLIKIQGNMCEGIIQILDRLLNKQSSLDEIKINYQSYEKDFLVSITLFNRNISEAQIEVKEAPLVINEHREAMIHLKHIYYLINTFFYYMTVEKNRFTPHVIYTLQKMMEYLKAIQSLLQKPTEEKIFLAPIHEAPIVMKHPILKALVEDIDKELDGLKVSCEKISLIRFHGYRKSYEVSV
jgi:hypothetical protein